MRVNELKPVFTMHGALMLCLLLLSQLTASQDVVESTRRLTRGLGLFAGADFPCDGDRDAFVGASWSRGACLMKCASSSTGAVPRCEHAMAVCKRLPHCTTLDVNVEGSVATLKRETELSRRTSRVKDISVRHVRRVRGARGTRKRLHGLHGWCAEHEVD